MPGQALCAGTLSCSSAPGSRPSQAGRTGCAIDYPDHLRSRQRGKIKPNLSKSFIQVGWLPSAGEPVRVRDPLSCEPTTLSRTFCSALLFFQLLPSPCTVLEAGLDEWPISSRLCRARRVDRKLLGASILEVSVDTMPLCPAMGVVSRLCSRMHRCAWSSYCLLVIRCGPAPLSWTEAVSTPICWRSLGLGCVLGIPGGSEKSTSG